MCPLARGCVPHAKLLVRTFQVFVFFSPFLPHLLFDSVSILLSKDINNINGRVNSIKLILYFHVQQGLVV